MADSNNSADNETGLWSKLRKPVISVFIIFYIYSVGLWLTAKQPWRNFLLKPVRPIVLYTGLWQSFAVFSPNPRKVNLHFDAVIKYDDGTTEIWNYPRMDRLGFFERMQKNRYRKYGNSHLNWNKEKVLWPDFARWVARQHVTDTKKPVHITLRRHWAYTPPPEEGLGKPAPEHDKSHEFFKYRVRPGDFK